MNPNYYQKEKETGREEADEDDDGLDLMEMLLLQDELCRWSGCSLMATCLRGDIWEQLI